MTGTAATMGIEENLALAQRRGQSRTLKIGITKKEREATQGTAEDPRPWS